MVAFAHLLFWAGEGHPVTTLLLLVWLVVAFLLIWPLGAALGNAGLLAEQPDDGFDWSLCLFVATLALWPVLLLPVLPWWVWHRVLKPLKVEQS